MAEKALTHSKRGSGLTPWPKGVSGNPAGMPRKALSVGKIWRDILEAKDEEDKEKRSRIIVLGHKLYGMAKEGNVPAAKLMLDRSYGQSLLEELPEEQSTESASAMFVMYLRSEGRESLSRFAEFVKKNSNGHDKG